MCDSLNKFLLANIDNIELTYEVVYSINSVNCVWKSISMDCNKVKSLWQTLLENQNNQRIWYSWYSSCRSVDDIINFGTVPFCKKDFVSTLSQSLLLCHCQLLLTFQPGCKWYSTLTAVGGFLKRKGTSRRLTVKV